VSMAKKILALSLLAFLFSIISLHPTVRAFAQQPTPSDDEVNAIASQLFCPVCENTPLDVCPTTACHQWRELIRQMLADGKSPTEIKQYFVDYYGARVLAEPPAAGLNWLVYVVPPLAFLAGAVLLFQAFRVWRKSPKAVQAVNPPAPIDGTAPVSAAPTDDKYISRLEKELKKRG